MRRIIAIIILLLPVAGIAETVSITVTGPTQQTTVQKQSVIVQPQSVTENVVIDSAGTAVVTVAVPGPQGIAGTGSVDVTGKLDTIRFLNYSAKGRTSGTAIYAIHGGHF